MHRYMYAAWLYATIFQFYETFVTLPGLNTLLDFLDLICLMSSPAWYTCILATMEFRGGLPPDRTKG